MLYTHSYHLDDPFIFPGSAQLPGAPLTLDGLPKVARGGRQNQPDIDPEPLKATDAGQEQHSVLNCSPLSSGNAMRKGLKTNGALLSPCNVQ